MANAHARPEEALLDGIAHQQQAAQCERQAAEPYGPARAEPLFQGGACRGGRGSWHHDLGYRWRRGYGRLLQPGESRASTGGAAAATAGTSGTWRAAAGASGTGAASVRGASGRRCRRSSICVLQPADPGQLTGHLHLQQQGSLARVEGDEQGDEADQNDQEFHSNRPSAAYLARSAWPFADHDTARSAERKSAAVLFCTRLRRRSGPIWPGVNGTGTGG